MKPKIVLSALYLFTLLFILAGMGIPNNVEAGVKVIIINKTGYDLKPLKYVKEMGDQKTPVGQTNLKNGKSYTFNLKRAGDYRAYGAFTRDGEVFYAKGKSYNLKEGSSYELTLEKVVKTAGGSSITNIKQEEFDQIK